MIGKAKRSEGAAEAPQAGASSPMAQAIEANARVKKVSRAAAALAALAVAGACFGAVSIATTNAAMAEEHADQRAVAVAKSDVKAGTVLTADMVASQDVPAKYRTQASLDDASAVVGKRAVVDVAAGTQLAASQFAADDAASALSRRIPDGKVAVTVDLSAANGFDGQLTVGDAVAVYSTAALKDGEDGLVCRSAEVASLGANVDGGASYATATLAVTEAEAQRVSQAKADGGVSLVLSPRAAGQGR